MDVVEAAVVACPVLRTEDVRSSRKHMVVFVCALCWPCVAPVRGDQGSPRESADFLSPPRNASPLAPTHAPSNEVRPSVQVTNRQSLTAPARIASLYGYLAFGAQAVHLRYATREATTDRVGSQAGAFSVSLALQLLVHERWGVIVTPFSWMPNGMLGRETDHWRLVRLGGGPALQLLSPRGRARCTITYEVGLLRMTDVDIDLFGDPPATRRYQQLAHTLSLRLHRPHRYGPFRIGARLEAGVSQNFHAAWVNLAFSMGLGPRLRRSSAEGT